MNATRRLVPPVLLVGVTTGLAFPLFPKVCAEHAVALPVVGALLAANRLARVVATPVLSSAMARASLSTVLRVGLVLQAMALGAFALGSATGQTFWLFLGRVIQGPSAAAVIVAAQAMTLEGQAKSVGLVRAATSLGLPLGVVGGGVLANLLGLTPTFVAGMGLVLASALLVPTGGVASPTRSTANLPRALWPVVLGLGLLNAAVTFSALGVVLTCVPMLGAHSSAKLGLLVAGVGVGNVLRVGRVPTALGVLLVGLVGVAFGGPVGVVALALVGVGAGRLSTLASSLAGELVEPRFRGAALSWSQLAGDVGGSAGPLIGASAMALGAWAPFAAAALVVAALGAVGLRWSSTSE